jgi:hypothetical protein
MKHPVPLDLLEGLPGGDRIRQGLEDLSAGRRTVAACLIRIARPRLSRARLVPSEPARDDGAELDLYQMLASEGPRAHSCYNALLRELVSFEHALDHRLTRRRRAPAGDDRED